MWVGSSRPATDMMLVLRRLQELGRRGEVSLFVCFITKGIRRGRPRSSVAGTNVIRSTARDGRCRLIFPPGDDSAYAVRKGRRLGVVRDGTTITTRMCTFTTSLMSNLSFAIVQIGADKNQSEPWHAYTLGQCLHHVVIIASTRKSGVDH